MSERNSGSLTCPQCSSSLPREARICPHCGVDLALLALLAERAYLDGAPEPAMAPAAEAMVPRLGEYLLDQGLLSPAQLESALERQRKQAEAGQKQLLGQTLISMGLLDRETLDRAITRQIVELHAALQEANRTLEGRVEERTSELRRALERVTELNQIKANLISNVSHELRTPLAHIKGYVELLSEAQLGPISDEQGNALSVVRRSTDRLERLIEDLIEYSTASREGIRIRLEAVNLAELAEDIVAASAEKAEKAGVQVSAQIVEGTPPMRADPDRIRWVLYQLVDNGIKFTPPGGTVVLSGHSDDGLIQVTVQDSGIGIPPERVEEIFEPFHQLDGSPTRRYGGTGLGLALVQLILSAHGAEVQVESEEGQGSRFTFPLAVDDNSA